MTDAELVALKLFPRNVTARADHAVRGNPVTTRPESGVENSFPGLEFDVRNLDKAFFPGLIFEFHSSDAVSASRGAEVERCSREPTWRQGSTCSLSEASSRSAGPPRAALGPRPSCFPG